MKSKGEQLLVTFLHWQIRFLSLRRHVVNFFLLFVGENLFEIEQVAADLGASRQR